ncbi:hypothetical protein PVK06_033995 [Gossypium arboreum]|uniref:Uncharacterized protein n=1 Tax=Gossypium arboreum TaxID=29729 RepID=A0ABR0NDI4_GOSAR|nr:hypothetical protein PVK06_033995 [Gossypium arboreum]
MVIGDFKEIMFSFEKRCGRLRSDRNMTRFCETLEECDLNDLVFFSRKWYTWERGKFLENNVHKRLDRGVENQGWCESFPGYSLKHLTGTWRICLQNYKKLGEVLDVEMERFMASKRNEIHFLDKRLVELSSINPDEEMLIELEEVKLALNLEADKEEVFWEQRARANWIKFGDRNKYFFHNFSNQQKKRNRVRKLRGPNG